MGKSARSLRAVDTVGLIAAVVSAFGLRAPADPVDK